MSCGGSSNRAGCTWSFDGDGALLRLVSEAWRIRLAHLFDPYLAVHAARIEPLPHQIAAVYGEMLPRQPLRFLLADDPGAGKTIMAGLLIKELMIRGDVERCLIVAPGTLVEQWQEELNGKFALPFAVLTREGAEAARAGNAFAERNLLIARLDVLSRNPEIQAQLEAAQEWDLIVVDEAHRMSASFFGGEVKYTQRYRLGKLLGGRARHFLLMTATPHNGKEEDFQLFMALLDADRFEGRFRDGVHRVDASDLMRRLTKEELLRFDGRPLFPERRAETVKYALSGAEAALYAAVTDYVRNEMNRAERFGPEGGDRRVRNVGFALTILQRRLASSPAAIHESLRRRRARLAGRLAEERAAARGREAVPDPAGPPAPFNADEDELEDAPGAEAEAAEEAMVDRATAARTLAELEAEIATLHRLEAQAADLRHAGTDTKWNELNDILDQALMTDGDGNRRKLIVFTEARDTLTYLAERIRGRLGRPEAVVTIHGGVGRADRRKAVEAFTHDKEVLVLVANDAAGEGVNLHRAHLMVNYDLPWNPNRLEQRFGRIHRIGQTEVCHCWNLVAKDTREGEVYARLLDKIEAVRAALGGKVYDVLGRLFEARALRELLIDAIRYGDRPEVRQRLFRTVDDAADGQHLLGLVEERALARDRTGAADAVQMRADMERAAARRLQPFHIQSFFLEAFRHLGGRVHRRETGRWAVTRVPGALRKRRSAAGAGLLPCYERVCFEKAHIDRTPVAAWLCPGHPLLDGTLDALLERHGGLLKQGAALVDETDGGEALRVLFYIESAVEDGRTDRGGRPRMVSQRLDFLEVDEAGRVREAGPAPYLDYRPLEEGERERVAEALETPWLMAEVEGRATRHAASHLAPRHLSEVRDRRLPEIDKVEREVKARLQREIHFWDGRAEELKAQERAGEQTRLPAERAAARAAARKGPRPGANPSDRRGAAHRRAPRDRGGDGGGVRPRPQAEGRECRVPRLRHRIAREGGRPAAPHRGQGPGTGGGDGDGHAQRDTDLAQCAGFVYTRHRGGGRRRRRVPALRPAALRARAGFRGDQRDLPHLGTAGAGGTPASRDRRGSNGGMKKPKRTDRLEIEVADFGPIVEAKVDLRPLTVFIGPSNTGKSYLAILIYALHRFFGGDRMRYLGWRFGSGFRLGRDPKLRDMPEKNVEALLNFGRSLADDPEAAAREGIALPPLVAESLRLGFDETAQALGREVARCFGMDDPAAIKRRGRRTKARVFIRRRTPKNPDFATHTVTLARNTSLRTSIPSEVPIPVDLGPGDGVDYSFFMRRLDEANDDRYRRQFATLEFLPLLGDILLPSLVGPLHSPAYYLPADRAGIMHTLNVVLSALIAKESAADLYTDAHTSTLFGVRADFSQQLLESAQAGHTPGNPEQDLGKSIEENILKGKILIKRSPHINYPRFVYRPERWKTNLGMANASAMVSELAPVVLYLRYVVGRGNVLIVEEPETNLHPAMQVELTRELARLVEAGVRVIVTTHSEWLIEELSNIVRRSELPKADRGDGAVLRPEQVGAWLFEPKKRPRGSVVRELAFGEYGLSDTGFDEVASALHNDWADIASRIEEHP